MSWKGYDVGDHSTGPFFFLSSWEAALPTKGTRGGPGGSYFVLRLRREQESQETLDLAVFVETPLVN
jgi:hypothetical protein